MKTRKWSVLVYILIFLMIFNSGSGPVYSHGATQTGLCNTYLPIVVKDTPPTATITSPQPTNTNGQTTFTLPDGTVNVSIVDDAFGTPLPGINTQLLYEGDKAYVLMVDPQGRYYPEIKEVPIPAYSDSSVSAAIPFVAAIVIAAVLILEGKNIYEFVTDLPEIENMGLGWYESCWTVDQLVNYMAVVTGFAGIVKLKYEIATHGIKGLAGLLKHTGDITRDEVMTGLFGQTVKAIWCENQLPNPFRVKYTSANTIIPLMVVLDNLPLQPCGEQVSTCPAGTGHLYGRVIDATTGNPLELVEISSPYAEYFAEMTNYTGDYSTYRAPAGYLTVEARVWNYIPQSKVVYVTENGEVELNFELSPVTNINEIRAVLTWGATPSDLDSHLWTPVSNPFHIYYGSRGSITQLPWAFLDVDDTSGYGPETISVVIDKIAGTYTLGIYQYSSTGTLPDSSGTVTIYRADSVLKTYRVSQAQGTGRWWYIADFTPYRTILGTWGITFTDVNRLQLTSPR